jgi:predicted  nucleic acid-binding Zn-ribbon protein
MSGSAAESRRGPRQKQRSPLRWYLLLLVFGFALIVLGEEVGFFLFLMLMGAALSYLGDQLGSYCGKNRLSILGLRPKHTANLVNLSTGLLITGMTFFGAGLMSENVRIALFRVRELRGQARRLAEEGGKLRKDIETVRTDLASTRDVNRDLAEEKRSLTEQKALLESANTSLESRNDELAGDNSTLEQANTVLSRDVGDLQSRREALNLNIEEKLEEIARLNRALDKKETAPVVISRGQVLLEETVAVPMTVTTEVLQPLMVDVSEKIRTTVELLDVKFDAGAAAHLAEHGAQAVLVRLAELRRFFAAAAAAAEAGTPDAAAVPVECHISPVSTRNVSVGEALTRISFEVTPDRLVFRRGDEVARTVVDGTLSEAQILDQLVYFDRQVRTVLREKGVAPSALRRRGLVTDSGQLLRLVRLAERSHRVGGEVVVWCTVDEDLFAFGDPLLSFSGRFPEPVLPPALAAQGGPGEGVLPQWYYRDAGISPPVEGILDVEPQVESARRAQASTGAEGMNLTLPEPGLSPRSLSDAGSPLMVPRDSQN